MNKELPVKEVHEVGLFISYTTTMQGKSQQYGARLEFIINFNIFSAFTENNISFYIYILAQYNKKWKIMKNIRTTNNSYRLQQYEKNKKQKVKWFIVAL